MDAHPDVDVLFGDAAMGNDRDGYVSFVEEYGGTAFLALPHASRNGMRVFERRPFFLQLATRNVMFLGSMFIRRDFFRVVSAFDPALCGAADWNFFMKCVTRGVVAFSEGPAVSRYVKHETGMSTNSDHMAEEFIRALDAVRRESPLDDVERRHVNERLRAHVFGWAWAAYEKADYPVVRQRLRMGKAFGQMGAREAAYLALTYLPSGVISAIRRARRVIVPAG
jgi:hypothetical protein